MSKVRRVLERSIDVQADVPTAWAHLIEPVKWPSWARHIRSVDIDPPGRAVVGSTGRVRLKNGTSARQRVTEVNEPQNWRWDGKFLWLELVYDHIFEAIPGGGTRITFVVDGGGIGSGSIGRLFGAIYARNLDRALPHLRAELSG